MTTEEKAKAYDKALDDIRAIYPNLKGDAKLAVEHAFPELAESEDERIRKNILKKMRAYQKQSNFFSNDEIAYLEKQKEQKPAEEDGPFNEDEFLENELSAFLQNYDKEYDDDAAVSDVARHFYEIGKKQKEQKQELRESEDERIRTRLLEYFHGFKYSAECPVFWEGLNIDNILAWLEKHKEPHYTKRNALFDKCVENCDPEIMKRVSDEIDAKLQKEQNPVEPIEFDNEFENQVSHLLASVLNGEHEYNEGFVKYAAQSLLGYAKNELKPVDYEEELEKCKKNPLYFFDKYMTIKQKPSKWSEEDEYVINKVLNWAEIVNPTSSIFEKLPKEKFIERLKSIKPQPQTETNEYITPHKKFFQWIYNRLIDVHGENPNVDYMRSFKKRIDNLQFNEPNWKSSGERMKALNEVINTLAVSKNPHESDYLFNMLNELRKDIKNL